MSKLLELRKLLYEKAQLYKDHVFNYTVPDLWNCFDYSGEETKKTPWGELIVNPYRFYLDLIDRFILKNDDVHNDFSLPLSNTDPVEDRLKGGDWIKKAVVYSMMIRTSTSWDHDRTGELDGKNLYNLKETGTFVKSLAILSLLKKMGVTAVYLLPISKFSLKGKKGELGSPYGVSNFFRLDPELKDPITGDKFTVEDEFSAFVEACHRLGMRVMIDIIPRTNSVNSDLILEHPDWFYWIDVPTLQGYKPPYVPGLGENVLPEKEFLPIIYQSHEVRQHISAFRKNPKDLDPVLWKKVLKRAQNEKTEILDIIQQEFNMTVAPAFSDHVNDPQPAWTDVTFFRMYMDHPTESKRFHDRDYEPYILFDVIKSNLYQGEVRNEGLWQTLSDIIPFYQTHFGIDGARIDMGHALPEDLVAMIINKARANDPDFCFIAEQMYPEKAESSRKAGYNMIIGNGFMKEPKVWDHQIHGFFYDTRHLDCPMFACGETHDTPRLAARDGGRNLAKMLTVMNLFMPNGVPFINSGQEVYELQPMNTGLDCRPNEAYVLDSKDPYYGKLALFDKYVLHYLNSNRWDLPDALEYLTALRSAHINTFTRLENVVPLGFNNYMDPGMAFGFIDDDKRWLRATENNIFIVVANTDVYNSQYLTVHLTPIRECSGNMARFGRLLYSTHGVPRDVHEFNEHWDLSLSFEPGEVKIIRM